MGDAVGGESGGGRGLFTNVRLTRMGIDYGGVRADRLWGADLNAKVEIDYETLVGTTPESPAIPRIRLAYAQMTWREFSLLAGQDWDVISPLNPMINDDTLMWAAGNLGDRRPMFRVKWDHQENARRRLSVALALGSGGSVDVPNLDAARFKTVVIEKF